MYVSMYVCDCKGWCFAALLLRIDVYLRDEESRRQPSDAVPASNRGAAILRCGLHEEGSPGRINKASLVRRIGGGGAAASEGGATPFLRDLAQTKRGTRRDLGRV